MKTVSARLYPTWKQEQTLCRFLRVSCWVYNQALEHRIKSYKRRGESVSLYSQQALLTHWRGRMDWLKCVPVEVERDALRRIDWGMRAFFRRVKNGQKPGFPRFRSHRRYRSFEVLSLGKYLRDGNRVYVSGIGLMKYRGMQEFEGRIKGIRVLQKARGWFVQLIVDDGLPSKERRKCDRCVGIDLGLTSFATLSNGEKIENPRWYQSSQRYLRKLSRRASRTKKGSNRRRKAYEKVARFHERIADIRRDWIHKITRRLIDEYDLIAVEDLDIEGMSRSRLSKSISDVAWGQFLRILEYKAASAGVTVVRVDPRGTSQECSECGRIVPKELSDRVHSCSCGYTACRDVNAARNILNRVPRVTGESTPVESTLIGAKC